MSCAFSALWCGENASPNVPFAALTLRWAMDGLGFQPVFCTLTKLTQMYPNIFRFQLGFCLVRDKIWLNLIKSVRDKSKNSARKQKIRVFALKIAQKMVDFEPFLPIFKNRSLSQTRRSLSESRRSLSQTRRSFFGYCFLKIPFRPLESTIQITI